MKFLLKSAVAAVALWLVTQIDALEVSVVGGEGDAWWKRALVFLGVGAVLAALNALVKPVLKVLTFPVLLLTLGLFSVIITWFILWLTEWITHWSIFGFMSLELDGGFWKTLGAALIIAIASQILEAILKRTTKSKSRSKR